MSGVSVHKVSVKCIRCEGGGSVDGDECRLCGGGGWREIEVNEEMKESIKGQIEEQLAHERERKASEKGVVKGMDGLEVTTKLDVNDLAEFLHEKGLMDKPYNVTVTPSLAAFLDVVIAGVGTGEPLPVGVTLIEHDRVEGFRSMYGFTYTLQASRQLAEEGPGKIVTGTRYGPLLVLGSPALPDGTFYLQYILNDPADLDELEEEKEKYKRHKIFEIDDNLLIRGMYRVRHFFANIYDYSSDRWPDGWYRMRRAAQVDEVTYVKEGRASHGQGIPLMWAANLSSGQAYSFEPVFVLDLFEWAIVKEVLIHALRQGQEVWWSETEWTNVKEGIERILGK